jgi:hypothetical protein
MLYKFTNTNKYGNLRHRIIYSPDGEGLKFNPKGFGPFVKVEVFRYKYEHSLIPPHLFVDNEGQKYIVPTWQKVLPETTLEDINWVKPKPKKVSSENHEFQFESKSDPGHFYKVTVKNNKVDCTCSGKWRAKDRQCRHMKDVKKQLKLK